MPVIEPWSRMSVRQQSSLRPRIFPHGQNDLTLPASGYLTRSTRRNCRRSPIPTKNRPSCRARWAQLFFPFSNRQKSCPGEISAQKSALKGETAFSFSVHVGLHRSKFCNYEVVTSGRCDAIAPLSLNSQDLPPHDGGWGALPSTVGWRDLPPPIPS